MYKNQIIIIIFFLFLNFKWCLAGVGCWSNNGLFGGNINSIAIDPNTSTTIYAGTKDGGVFKSTNGGLIWQAINVGLGYEDVNDIKIDPATSTILYAGTTDLGLLKSIDQGTTWKSTGLTSPVSSIAINPISSNVLYAGTADGVYQSINYGGTWTQKGLSGMKITSVVIDRENPDIVYAGTFGNGLFKSGNGGTNWQQISDGTISTLAIVDSSTIYVGKLLENGDGTILKTTDGGKNWGEPITITTSIVISIQIDLADSSILYAATFGDGVFKTTDGGENWDEMNSDLTSLFIHSLAIDPKASNVLYVGSYGGGIFKSTDGAETWQEKNTGLTNLTINSIAFEKNTVTTIYVATDKGIFKTTDNGKTWEKRNNGLINLYITSIVYDPTTSTTLYAGSKGGGVSKSTDGGQTWRPINEGITNFFITSIAIDPTTSTTLYAGTSDSFTEDIFKSTDGGENWISLDIRKPITCIVIDPGSPTILYAGTEIDGLQKSIDGGNNWYPIIMGLDVWRIYSLYLNPNQPWILYAVTNKGLFKSIDSGENWNSILGRSDISSVFVDPVVPDIIYFSTLRDGVYRSVDGGSTWQRLIDGLSCPHINVIAINLLSHTTIYAGSVGDGLYSYITPKPKIISVSPSQGSHITSTKITIHLENLLGTPIVKIGNIVCTDVIVEDKDTITAIVPSEVPHGIYDVVVTNVDGQSHTIKAIFKIARPPQSILYTYPNPAKGVKEIAFRWCLSYEDSEVTIDIYDLSYDWITTLTGGDLTQDGYYEKKLDISNLASGVYIYVFKTKKEKIIKKFMVIK